VQAQLAHSFGRALGERLVALVVYGSAAERSSLISGFSDFDLAVFVRGGFDVEDSIAVQARLGDLETTPFDYLQTKLIDVTAPPVPVLVPGAFSVFYGELPDAWRYLHDDDSLREAGRCSLTALPGLLADDRAAWAVADGSARRRRLVRLMATQLKPALRSLLVACGEAPGEVWAAGWHELARRWREHDAEGAAALDAVLGCVPPTQRDDEVACGATLLRLLARIGVAVTTTA
jgi:predicted nucleotidyltransferase